QSNTDIGRRRRLTHTAFSGCDHNGFTHLPPPPGISCHPLSFKTVILPFDIGTDPAQMVHLVYGDLTVYQVSEVHARRFRCFPFIRGARDHIGDPELGWAQAGSGDDSRIIPFPPGVSKSAQGTQYKNAPRGTNGAPRVDVA